MTARRMKIADLQEEDLKKVQQLEDQMGTLIIALEPQIPLAELSEAQLELLNSLEIELGVVLIAYQK
jgi:hypothetical protein